MRVHSHQSATSSATSQPVAPCGGPICSAKDCTKPVKARGLCDYHYWSARRAWQRGEVDLPPKSKQPEGRVRWSEQDIADIVRRLAIESIATVAESYGIKAPGLSGVLKRHGIYVREVRKQHKSGPVSNAGMGLPGHTGVFHGHGAAAIAALQPGDCRWPVGDLCESGFMFCAAPRVAGKSYCAHHLAEAKDQKRRYGAGE